MELAELQKKTKEAEEVYEALKCERDVWISERTRAIREEASKIFGDRERALQSIYQELRQALTVALNEQRVAEGVSELPYPEGTVVVRNSRPAPWSQWGVAIENAKNGGVIQVFRPGDPERENTSKYHSPPVGMVIVRLLTKDGKPGKMYVPWKPTKDHWVVVPS